MIDAESLVHERFTAAFPDWHVASEQDPGMRFPALIYRVTGDGQTGNGPGRWPLALAVNILDGTETVFDRVRAVYAEVHSWRGRSSEHGHITLVEDTSLITRIAASQVDNRTIQQYAGAFALIARA